MDKNEIIAHPGAFPFKVLLEAVLDRIVTTEELLRSGELDSITIGILQLAEEEMLDILASRGCREGFMEYYSKMFLAEVTRHCEASARRLLENQLRYASGTEYEPDVRLSPEELRELSTFIMSRKASSVTSSTTSFIQEKLIQRLYESVRRDEFSLRSSSFGSRIRIKRAIEESEICPIPETDSVQFSCCKRMSRDWDGPFSRRSEKTEMRARKKPEPNPGDYHAVPFSLMSGIKRILGTDRKVYASLYTPNEVKALQRFRLQVHLYNLKQAFEVARKAKELDAEASLMDTNPLAMNLKKGTRVTVSLDLNPEEATAERTSATLIWNGEPVSAQFFVKPRVPAGSDLSGEVTVSVDGVAVGTLTFLTRVGRRAGEVPADVNVHRFRKVFISYAHEDEATARAMASAYRAQGTAYFFDHHSLESGAVFNEEIRKNIEESDLFLLLWSQHAARSEYVGREYRHALKFAYPQKPREAATLTFRPHFVEPVADPPSDLKGIYNFSSDLLSNRPAQG